MDAATRCLAQLTTFKKQTSLVARYILILEDLQQEAPGRIGGQATPSDCSIRVIYTDAMALKYANIIGVRMPFPASGHDDFGRVPTDIATWMRFEPLVGGHPCVYDGFLKFY